MSKSFLNDNNSTLFYYRKFQQNPFESLFRTPIDAQSAIFERKCFQLERWIENNTYFVCLKKKLQNHIKKIKNRQLCRYSTFCSKNTVERKFTVS